MCGPLAAASAGAGALGSIISGQEARANAAAQQNARNAVTTAELERQKGYGDQARTQFDSSLGIYAPGAQTQGLADSQRTVGDALTANTPTTVGSITTAYAPSAVGDSEQAKLASVFNTAATRNRNLANLTGYTQQQFGNNIALNNNARNIDTIGDFARVSSGVSGVEQRAAGQNATRAPSGLGDILRFAGTVGANQAGRGVSIFSGGAPESSGFSLTGTGGH